jgi:hypothetical protein
MKIIVLDMASNVVYLSHGVLYYRKDTTRRRRRKTRISKRGKG